MNSGQRKRKGSEVNKSRSRRRRRGATSSMATATEPIELEESSEEVVDLTCESLEPVVVDLTHNDSVVVSFPSLSPRRRRNAARTTTQTASCILSSDDEDTRDNDLFSSRRSRDLLPPNDNSSRFYRADVFSFLPNAATYSAVSASETPLKMSHHVQPAGKN
ncbi:E3 ubiquitin-protein ligase RNF4 isoform X2 [Leptodactylus fuscus]|uniref:E3 ubiquitin-protein ligase RNF4 isoform X2 n=1 Tax=Leptodactylus fuscus TaxID=238119 RepID=UPI003F4EAAC0